MDYLKASGNGMNPMIGLYMSVKLMYVFVLSNAPGDVPRWAVSEVVNSSPSARGSVRYGARFHRFS